MPHAPAIAFVTLGCPKNEVDSDRMAAAVEASAYRLVADPSEADVVVLNTCSFIEAATEESIAEAFDLADSWRPARTGRRLIVAGCMVSRYGDELADAMPEPDAFVAVADERSLLEVVERITGVPASPRASVPGRTTPGTTAYLKVSEGCDRRCAYCTIPTIRGPFVSAPVSTLLAEATFLVGRGAREIVLIGQDISSWGRDSDDGDLASLVERLGSLEGDFRVRLMYVQPDGITPRLLEAMAADPRVCRYLDLPLQHASARVLDAMGRTGDSAHHLALLGRIREALPGVSLRTTVMTGFPGETDAESAELEAFVAEAGFDYVGVFAYSPEDGTRAAVMPGQIPADVRLERAQRLRDLADTVGFERATARIGMLQQTLVEGVDEDGALWGRTCGQAPEVDGITFISTDAAPGGFVQVRITDAIGYDLVGVVE
ncbi:MAG: 30S ribosomal protein S12 methylthiotransferase RimO [Coriobacteriia bacterium]|nr:30S ribosomal protein S12 methylthiotransferase RimO [Coriobacteriia bacterium]